MRILKEVKKSTIKNDCDIAVSVFKRNDYEYEEFQTEYSVGFQFTNSKDAENAMRWIKTNRNVKEPNRFDFATADTNDDCVIYDIR